MRWDQPNNLGKTVEAKATNRPVKIAYLVPFADTPYTQMHLDAVFFESYTRWGGAYTLIVPTSAKEFLADEYNNWLKHYDPDFIYSYVDLEPVFVEKIDYFCCPIAFLKHKVWNRDDREVDWRTFVPRWDHYIQPISSISTIQSPSGRPMFPNEERPREPTVLTQYQMKPASRFLADNFGTGFNINSRTHAISGLFKTLCLVPDSLPENIIAGTERCHSELEAFRAISDHTATSVAHFSMINSAGIPRPESIEWASAFRIFIGRTPIDRINFWNCRHLGSHWTDSTNALILDLSFFENDELIKQLGQYLNKNNFLGENGSGPYQAQLHSDSLTANVLNLVREKLQPHTWNLISVGNTFNSRVVPRETDLSERTHHTSSDTTAIKMTEDFNEISANEPAHLVYIAPQFRSLVRGQWVVDLTIQRHNNLSRFSNVVDIWTLPRCRKVSRAFTERLSKPTLGGSLALVPSNSGFPFRRAAENYKSSYEISLPSDEAFFRYLALELHHYPADDLRSEIRRPRYVDLDISDKGQNLRGVISMFEDLSTAFGILTNKFWRTVLASAKEDAIKPLTFDLNKLKSFIPDNKEVIQRITKELHFESDKITKKYLTDSLVDTLEYLVRCGVFYKVYNWRCDYCGHMNSRNFDNMKIKSLCDICNAEHFSPIDLGWEYELNGFVHRSLQRNSGLTVLWALGLLQDRLHSSFWYLPEVDLYESVDDANKKNEIDALCMVGNAFYVIEAKLSASVFLNKPGSVDKFVKVITMIRPDVAMLAFERYCIEGEDAEAMKAKLNNVVANIRQQIGPWIDLEVIVAQDNRDFNDLPSNLGWYGPRMRKYS